MVVSVRTFKPTQGEEMVRILTSEQFVIRSVDHDIPGSEFLETCNYNLKTCKIEVNNGVLVISQEGKPGNFTVNPGYWREISGCKTCNDTGMISTGSNDVPCDCPAGDTAMFTVVGVEGLVSGTEVKSHFQNDSPEPIHPEEGKIFAFNLPGRREVVAQSETGQDQVMLSRLHDHHMNGEIPLPQD